MMPTKENYALLASQLLNYAEDTLRSQFCFLTQRVHVFSDTLRQNLQFASAVNISDEKMIEVLNQVGLGKCWNKNKA